MRSGRDGMGPLLGWIYDEPELHFADDVLVPDLAGWRVERMPTVPDVAAFTLTPRQGVRGAAALDPADRPREEAALYARAQIGHCWLVDLVLRMVEVFALVEQLLSAGDDDKVRAAPVAKLEIDLGELWAPVTPRGS